MEIKNTLGIVVNSNRFFDQVTQLAEAALQDQKIVRVHLLGPGWAYIQTEAYMRLHKAVHISICAISARHYAAQHIDTTDPYLSVVHPKKLSKILQDCHRHVVF